MMIVAISRFTTLATIGILSLTACSSMGTDRGASLSNSSTSGYVRAAIPLNGAHRLSSFQRVNGYPWQQFKALGMSDYGEVTQWTGPNIWFMDTGANSIKKMNLNGKVTVYPEPGRGSSSFAVGPDGNMWITNQYSNDVTKMTPTGTFSQYSIPTPGSRPGNIVSGPDNALWFTETDNNGIARIIARIGVDGAITENRMPPGLGSGPNFLASGSDGNVWFITANFGMPSSDIGKITSNGIITLYSIPGLGYYIVAGPDGALWFAGVSTSGHYLGRITTSGDVTQYFNPLVGFGHLLVGPDGDIWSGSTDPGSGDASFQRFSLVSKTFEAPLISNIPVSFWGLTIGPDGNVWFAEQGKEFVGAYLWHNITVTPGSLTFQAPGQTGTLNVSETNFQGQLSGSSTNRAVATVARGNPGTLVVTATGVGSCEIQVSDGKLNILRIPVTVN